MDHSRSIGSAISGVDPSTPDGPAHLPTIWGSQKHKWHRGHLTLQSGSPLVQKQSRDSLEAVTSIAGVDKLYETAGLENTMTTPRKPVKIPRRVVRVGIPTKEKVDSWVTFNNMLAGDEVLAKEATRILRTAPQWLQRCGIHANMDPVLGRCSWEEESSICIRFRQTQRRNLQHVDRTTMRFNTCAMLNKLQKICWPDNANFEIQDAECVSYIAHKRWTLKGNHTEVDTLMTLIRKGDDVFLTVLEKMRAAPWKTRPPNARMIINRCEERDDPWEDIPQEDDYTSEMSEDTSPPH
jgi:hypothetical protein